MASCTKRLQQVERQAQRELQPQRQQVQRQLVGLRCSQLSLVQLLPYGEGVSFTSCFCQPPSILPISIKGGEICEKSFVSMVLSSHAICIKNFRRSSLNDAFFTIGNFCSLAAKPAVKISSDNSMKRLLIFSPSE